MFYGDILSILLIFGASSVTVSAAKGGIDRWSRLLNNDDL